MVSLTESENKLIIERITLLRVGVLILVGGEATRLNHSQASENGKVAKCLIGMNVAPGEHTMVDYVVTCLQVAGFQNRNLRLIAGGPHIVEIRNFVDEEYPYLNIIEESHPAGTAGAAYLGMQSSSLETFVITPSDTLFPYELLPEAVALHQQNQYPFTWMVTTDPGENAQNEGRILIDKKTGVIVHVLEGKEEDPENYLTDDLIQTTSAGVIIATRGPYVKLYQDYPLGTGETRVNLYSGFLPWLIEEGGIEVGTYDIEIPAPDLGTPERIEPYLLKGQT